MEIDARGMKCPMPIVKLGAAIRGLAVGEEISITADDKGFPPDLRAWCEKTGHTLVELDEHEPQRLVAIVKKAHE